MEKLFDSLEKDFRNCQVWCTRISQDYPAALVMPINLLGFPYAMVCDTLTPRRIRQAATSGYWKDGKFMLFSVSELTSAAEDEDEESAN